MKKLTYGQKGFFAKLQRFATDGDVQEDVRRSVAEILAAVREEGDAAVIRYTAKFDGYSCKPADLRIAPAVLHAAVAGLNERQRAGILEAINCVRSFHQHGLPRNWRERNPHGAWVGEQWYPIERVGIYVPAGNVPLVSTVVMTTTLAHLAGVPSVAVFTPGDRTGAISPQMLAGLALCGVTEVYRIGGAQAIAAMAYGTQTIPAVRKVMGPGNAYVAEAQRMVFGQAGVDLLPGPSEAMAIVDKTAEVEYVAADLLAQAEHGSGRERVYLVHTDEVFARAVAKAALRQMRLLRHASAIRKVWQERTIFIRVPDLSAAAEVANFVAPEHLELHVAKAHYKQLIAGIRTAGAILCGHDTPTVLGDFTAGPSHTLPTATTGRFFSGLKITDFMRRSSVVEYNRAALRRARDVVRVFAELEDLDGHGRSMEIRFE